MKNKKWIRHFFIAMLTTIAVTGCGISGTGGPSRGAEDTEGKTPQSGQAVLGPIVGANVSVRDVDNPNEIACSTTTTDSDNLSQAGAIVFSETCVFAERLYLVTVSGGVDVDFDDDGEREQIPIPNTGEFRALLTGEQMLKNDWHVNVLTEVAYQGVQYALAQGANNIPEILDSIAQLYIQNDLNNDGVINRLDIAVWDPLINAGDVINLDKLRSATFSIHLNLNRTLDNVPGAISLGERIDTLAPAHQVLNFDNLLVVATDSALLVYGKNENGWQLNAHLALGWIYDMAVNGKTLYAALGDNGIAEIDLSDPAKPYVKRSFSHATRRITTLGEHVVFSFRTPQGGLQLRELAGDQSLLIADTTNESADRLRSFSNDDVARNGILKTIGSTVYWSTRGHVQAFTYESGGWIDRLLFGDNVDPDYRFDVVDDIEVSEGIAYVVVRQAPQGYAQIADSFPSYSSMPDEYKFDFALNWLNPAVVTMVDISDIDNPAVAGTVTDQDIKTVRRWDQGVVALGASSISTRNPVDLEVDAEIALPSSFRGFDPVHGLARIGDTIAVAARENGVLLLKPPVADAHLYVGGVFAQAAISGAAVTVTRLRDNVQTCAQTSSAEGAVTIPSDCLVLPGYYLLSATGGTQTIDGIDKPFNGELRSVMLSKTIARNGWNITPLTEVALRVAQTGDGTGFKPFSRAETDIADWLLTGDRSIYQYSIYVDPFDLFSWQPHPILDTLSIDPQRWRDAVTAISEGSFQNSMLAGLMSPVTNLLTFDDDITDVIVDENAVFIAHSGSIDIVDRTATPWRRHTIARGANKLFATAGKLTALNSRTGRVDFYSISDLDNIQHIASISIPNFATDSAEFSMTGQRLAQACLSAEVLYQIADSPHDDSSTVSAWRIDQSGAIALAPVQPSEHREEYFTKGQLRCNDNTLVEQWNKDYDIRVFHVDGNSFQRTATISAQPVYGFDLRDSELIVYSNENSGDTLSIYGIDGSGVAALVRRATVPSTIANFNVIDSRVRNNGSTTAVMSMNDIALYDTQTLQPKGSLPLNFSAVSAVSSEDGLWLWGQGKSVWQIGLPVGP